MNTDSYHKNFLTSKGFRVKYRCHNCNKTQTRIISERGRNGVVCECGSVQLFHHEKQLDMAEYDPLLKQILA